VLKRDWGQPNGTECDFGVCANGAPGCTYNGNESAACCFQEGTDPNDASSPPNLFGGILGDSDLEGGNDYNQAYQILQKVEAIMELQDRYQIGELRIHSGLVLDPLADPTIIEIFGDAAQAAPLASSMRDKPRSCRRSHGGASARAWRRDPIGLTCAPYSESSPPRSSETAGHG
jgi:hypothetical protein